jgi:hypothetical protein
MNAPVAGHVQILVTAGTPAAVMTRTPAAAEDGPPSCGLRQQIDDWILPLRSVGAARVDAEIGDRLQRIAPMHQCLVVLTDHGCAGLESMPPRLHGTVPAELQKLYATLIVERDPLLLRVGLEWRALAGTIAEHCSWLREHTRNADVIRAWLTRMADNGADSLAVVPARGWLSRGALFVFFAQRPAESSVFALFYASQRLAVALEMRYRPYIAELLMMQFTARELDVLRAGLKGAGDEEIAGRLDLSVDAIRYYYKKFKHRVPPAIGHLKPRELARILHHLGKL